jgi:predicted nucleic acid-binding protein
MASKVKAVLDACVLHPFHLRNLFLQLAVDDVIDLFWSDEISREWLKSVSARIAAAPRERLVGQLARINAVLPNANVQGWERHLAGIPRLPDDNDRHVVAAARQAGADYIVTWNMAHFPKAILSPLHVAAINPDDFLVDLLGADAALVIEVVERARLNLTRSAPDLQDYLDILANQKVTKFVGQLRSLIGGASES